MPHWKNNAVGRPPMLFIYGNTAIDIRTSRTNDN